VGAPAWQELRHLYGEEYFHENGSLNRSKLAQLVFADPEARRRLDGLIHPGWRRSFRPGGGVGRPGAWLVLVEVPLLFETGREAPLTGSSWWRPRRPIKSGV